MSTYYTRLCIAEIRFELLSIGYNLSVSKHEEMQHVAKQILTVVKKLDELEGGLEQRQRA